jgi:hypothetical protein
MVEARSPVCVAPNPFRESFQLKADHEDSNEYIIRLSAISGRHIVTMRGNIMRTNQELVSETKSRSSGSYVLYIKNKRTRQQATFKLVKIK